MAGLKDLTKKEKKIKKEKAVETVVESAVEESHDEVEQEESIEEKKESKKEKKERKKDKKEKKDKKRSSDDLEEIEIDLNEPVPLSKKQKRMIKKGLTTAEKLESKHPKAVPEDPNKPEGEEKTEKPEEPKKSQFAVWIGNLSFDTTKEDLTRFIVGKTSQFEDYSAELNKENPTELVKILETDITRVNLPKKEKKIKGFAYIDFSNSNHVATVISLSEQQLNGRRLLIKDAQSFEGRPKKDPVASLSKNPPSRILFVGNLSFDTTSDLLEEHFRHCGEIIKIRMATFEDAPEKCKGFAFIDFRDETGPTNALTDKSCKKLINRPLRMEFGEDRSKRTPNRRPFVAEGEVDESRGTARERQPERQERPERQDRPERSFDNEQSFERPRPVVRRPRPVYKEERVKSSVALASAQRASAAIVPSAGKKITFN